jgi:sulfur-oxidizing protein SoxA
MMKLRKTTAAVALAAFAGLGAASIALADGGDWDPNAKLVVNDDTTLVTSAPAPSYIPGLKTIYSGWLFRDPTTQAMETDDFSNPGMPAVDVGTAEWNKVDGTEGKSCASCHNGLDSMKGLRATLPKVNKAGQLWSMEDYINDCRTHRMGAKAWDWKSDEMKNMTAAISVQSRGMPMNVAIDGPAKPFWEAGEKMYYTRYGMLQLSCASCHEQHFGDHIRGDHLSQGQSNGFPVYRLSTGGLVALQDRLFGCIRDTRAESFAVGSPELHDLELYVASRGNGLSVEGVSVRP